MERDIASVMQSYYPTFNSFSAKGNVHVEDLYIRPEYPHQGCGRVFFTRLAEWIKDEITPGGKKGRWIIPTMTSTKTS